MAPTSTPVDATNYATTPSAKEIERELSRTVETKNPKQHFKADGDAVTTSDGAGGVLTAVAGVREPSADDTGELVFFWHGDTFLGWDSLFESKRLVLKSAGPGRFAVTYADYTGKATSRPVSVTYVWSGSNLVPDSSPPSESGTPISVTLKDDKR